MIVAFEKLAYNRISRLFICMFVCLVIFCFSLLPPANAVLSETLLVAGAYTVIGTGIAMATGEILNSATESIYNDVANQDGYKAFIDRVAARSTADELQFINSDSGYYLPMYQDIIDKFGYESGTISISIPGAYQFSWMGKNVLVDSSITYSPSLQSVSSLSGSFTSAESFIYRGTDFIYTVTPLVTTWVTGDGIPAKAMQLKQTINVNGVEVYSQVSNTNYTMSLSEDGFRWGFYTSTGVDAYRNTVPVLCPYISCYDNCSTDPADHGYYILAYSFPSRYNRNPVYNGMLQSYVTLGNATMEQDYSISGYFPPDIAAQSFYDKLVGLADGEVWSVDVGSLGLTDAVTTNATEALTVTQEAVLTDADIFPPGDPNNPNKKELKDFAPPVLPFWSNIDNLVDELEDLLDYIDDFFDTVRQMWEAIPYRVRQFLVVSFCLLLTAALVQRLVSG